MGLGKALFLIASIAALVIAQREAQRLLGTGKQEKEIPPAQTLFQRLRKSAAWTVIVLASTAVSATLTAIGAYEVFWPKPPTIVPAGDDFSLPFTFTNKNNYWYRLKVLQFNCFLGRNDPLNPRVKASGNTVIRGVDADPIEPTKWQSFTCGAAPDGYQTTNADLWIGVAYQTYLFQYPVGKPKGVSEQFTFKNGKWVSGPVY